MDTQLGSPDPSIVIACFIGAFSSHRRCDNLLHVSSGYPLISGFTKSRGLTLLAQVRVPSGRN